jgi:CHAT domain-containing protein
VALGILTLALVAALGAGSDDVSSALDTCDAGVLGIERTKRNYNCYATVARRFDPQAVIDHLEGVLVDHTGDGRLWMTLGGVALDHGADPKPALTRAVTELRAAALPQYEVQARLNLANRLEYEGAYDDARAQLVEARAVAEALGHPIINAIAELELQRSTIRYFGGGDVVAAHDRLAELLEDLPEDAPPPVRARILLGLRDAAVRLDRPREALSWSRASVELHREANDEFALSSALRIEADDALDLAYARYDLEGQAAYRDGLQAALDAALRSNNRFTEVTVRRSLAGLAEPPERASAFAACAKLAEEIDAVEHRTLCAAGRAVALAQKDPARARRIADDTFDRVAGLGVPYLRALALDAQARVSMQQGDLEAAWLSWSRMLDAHDEATTQQQSAASRGEVHAGQIGHFRVVVSALLNAGGEDARWLERAFGVMERMRAREALAFRQRAGIDDVDGQLAELAACGETPSWENAVSGDPNKAGGRRNIGHISSSEQRSWGRRGRCSLAAGFHHRLLAQVQRALEDDEAMLVFQVGDGSATGERADGDSWVVVITHDTATAHRVPPASEVGPAAAMLTAGLAGESSLSGTRSATALYSSVLAAPLSQLGDSVRRLVIVPDGELHRVPLGALVAPGSDRPLLERFESSVVPSATLWLKLRELSEPPRGRSLLAIADPTVPESLANRLAFSGPLAGLPGGRAEAKLAVAIVGGDSESRVGDDASEGALLDGAAFSVVHIAAHAIVDRGRPEGSGVVLASDGTHDGLATLAEISALDLRGALVVLASCQGADGDMLAGEGPLSPARAFFLAGARTVVAGLWPVRDDEAAALFAIFYRELNEGRTVGDALARAQAERRAAGAPSSAWAGFVVYGDGSMRLPPAPGPSRWLWALLAAGTVVLVSAATRPRRR